MTQTKRLGILSIAIAAAAIAGCVSTASSAGGGQALIDAGVGSDNFNRLGAADWVTKDGALEATSTAKEQSYLVSKSSYGDFALTVEFWATDDASSGVMIRCADPAKINSDTCYEVNIYDQRPDPSYGTASIVNVAKVAPMPKAGGKWNTLEITAKGPHLTVVFNGEKTVDVKDDKLSQGPIALQWSRGVLKFRNVQVKPL